MKLPTIKKILREDLKDAPGWINGVIDPLNSFMETLYQALNRNVTLTENVACFVKEIVYITPSSYPVMDDIQFMSALKTKAIGVMVMQAVEKSNYQPVLDPVYVPWTEVNGSIVIKPITGLVASKTYLIRLLVS